MSDAVLLLVLASCSTKYAPSDAPTRPDGGTDRAGSSAPSSDAGPTIIADAEPDDAETRRADARPSERDAAPTPVPKPDPPPFIPTACSLERLEPSSQCEGGECRVVFAGQLTCPGTISGLELAATAEHVFVHFGASATNQGVHRVIARIDATTAELSTASPIQTTSAILRAGPSGQLALIAIENTSATLHRLRTWPDAFNAEPLDAPGRIVDAIFDREGTLQLFSVGQDAAGSPATFQQRPPMAASKISSESSGLGRAKILGDGTPAFIFPSGTNAMRSVSRWTAASGSVAVADVPPAVIEFPFPVGGPTPDLVFAPSGSGRDVSIAYVSGDRLLLHGSPPQTLLSWPATANNCSGFELVPPPKICSQEETRNAAGERLVRPALARGARAEPWLVALLADATSICNWADDNGCIEERTCECRQYAALEYGASRLQIQPAFGTQPALRLQLPAAFTTRGGQFALAEREDGTLLVAIGWSEGRYEDARLHVRYFGVNTQ